MNENALIPEDFIITKIHIIRGEKVMLDWDLAELYDVETKYLKRQVRRNIERFPEDFMFVLTKEEMDSIRGQGGSLNWGGPRYLPMAFTEQGVAQLSSVLKSERAIRVNIQIVRLFTKMRRLLFAQKDLILKIQKMERELSAQGHEIRVIFEYLKKLLQKDGSRQERKRIGYK